MPCTRHRVFLATLICAAKNLNDSSPKNKHWCTYAQMFSQAEINLMEKQLLFLLDYNLNITEDEICHHASPFLDLYTFEEDVATPTSVSSAPLPVTPRLPTGCVVEAPATATIARVAVPTLAQVPAAAKRYGALPPALDRSISSSSLGSGSDGLLTPRSISPSTSSPDAHDNVEIISSYSASPADIPAYVAADVKTHDRAASEGQESLVRRIFGRRPTVAA